MADYVSNYTGAEIDGILEDAIELPEYDDDNIDMFLVCAGTHVEWRTVPTLPHFAIDLEEEYIDNDGRILAVTGSTQNEITSFEWVSLSYLLDHDYDSQKLLPTFDTANDLGKVLKITSNGPAWVSE